MLLNLDAGEDEHEPEELWALADVLAVACGGHAGDAASMTRLGRAAIATGRQLQFNQDSAVHHCAYFRQPKTFDFLRTALKL